ncbi:hypothetical protein [Dietzia massiliensis]|uniref:hypothetical protein n=1 Tax=Dietzia massiliensis TaxID=2697499 RepID=UPI001BD0DCCC|nr:hypothetical protein [Dietzia massiliensis]MBS7547678.1 hypothetical protein [Dietzia massiliensis]
MFNTAARGGSSRGLSPLQRSGLRAVTALAVTGAITAPLVGIATAQTGSLGSSGSGGSTPPASSTTPTSSTAPTTTPPPSAAQATVELRVLVLDDGDFSGEAFATRLAAEGVEVDRINVKATGRQAITRAMLADDATKTARYMGIVSVAADRTGLTPEENAVIDQFTADYGIREVSANVTPVAEVGLVPTTSGTNFDATTATLTAGALSGEWSYLDGPVPFENLSSTVAESWGYAATPAPGAQFVPLLTGPSGGAGVMMGVHTQGTRERLVMTVAMNQYQHHFKALSHGIITWLTRGVSTSLYRNVFNVQVDDVFLADDEWNPIGNCTFGADCEAEAPDGALTESRMVADDVGVATSWENSNGIELDMTFNAFGARRGDGLTDALLAAKNQLRWINHTWDHTNLDSLGQAEITAQIEQNITWARDNGVPLNPTELVTGQHSGTASGPARRDNPALAPALDDTGVTWIAGDASVEPNQRPLGNALTVPRHPMNIYYNTSTKENAVDEYNWIYTRSDQGGSGTCERNAASTCLDAPLPLESGFDEYIVPQEARHALSHALSMDPRPHYVHQSNITGDRILYPVLDAMVRDYRALFNDRSAPLRNPSHAELGLEMQRRAAWADAADSVTATVRGSTLVIENDGAASVEVPITTRSGSAFDGEAYAGSKSRWVTVPAGGEVTFELGYDVGFLTPDEDTEEPAVAARALPRAARAAAAPSPGQNSVVVPPINDATRVGAVGEGPTARG